MSEIGRVYYVPVNFAAYILIRKPTNMFIIGVPSNISLVKKTLLLLEHAKIVLQLKTANLVHLGFGDDLIRLFSAQRQLPVPFLGHGGGRCFHSWLNCTYIGSGRALIAREFASGILAH